MPIAPDGSPLPYPDSIQVGGAGGQPGIDDPRFREAIQLLEEILRGEPDDQDSAALAGLVEGLYKLLAGRQKEMDDALGGKMSPRMMRRGG